MLLACVLCTLPFDVHQDWDTVIYSCAWFPKHSVFLEGLEEQCSALTLIVLSPSSLSLSKHRCAVTGENPWRFYKTTLAFECVSNLSQQHAAAHCDLRDPCLLMSFILQNRWCWDPLIGGRASSTHPANVSKAHSCADICLVYHRRFILGKIQPPTSFCWSPQYFIMSRSLWS